MYALSNLLPDRSHHDSEPGLLQLSFNYSLPPHYVYPINKCTLLHIPQQSFKTQVRASRVAQWFGFTFGPEVWSWKPGIESYIRLPAWSLLLSLPVSLSLCLSWINKIFKKKRERQRHRQREKQAPCREPDVGLDPGSPGSHPGSKLAPNCWATGAVQSTSFNSWLHQNNLRSSRREEIYNTTHITHTAGPCLSSSKTDILRRGLRHLYFLNQVMLT